MNRDQRRRCGELLQAAIAVLLLAVSGPAAETVLLWPEGAPGAQGEEDADKPQLWAYLPPADKATGAAVVVCPGGGYGTLALDHEGHQVAHWLNTRGVAGFVLRYRHAPRYRHPAPLEDAQRAIRYVRQRAVPWKLSPHRIGIMGFSAGGHLASTAATHFDAGDAGSRDPVQRVSCRPDFAILAYPVISLREKFGHTGSRRNLLGDAPDQTLVDSLSNETQVTDRTPPVFLFHTTEDPGVPVENSLAFYAACRRAGVPAEMHLYQFGPHGVGLAAGDPVTSSWKERLADWLQASGFLADVRRAAVEGTVRVGGSPLRWGMITFVAADAPNKPVAFALVSRGSFRIPAERGPVVGTCRIEVRDLGSVGTPPPAPQARRLDQGTATCEVKEGTNTVALDL